MMRAVAALAAALAWLFWLVPAHASYIVQVGYADGLRGSPNFPAPWFGDPGVTFFGHFNPPDDAGADAGAIRIINDGATPITIDALSVDGFENGASFALWSASFPFILLPGNSAIFTETAFNNFDTSDQPIHSAPGSTAKPVVHVTVDLVLSDFTDVGQVLNTGGFDLALIPGRNEALGWRDISSTCGINCPGNQTPEPATLGLLGLALAAMGVLRVRRRNK
jgi:hypothetical protein